MGEEISDKFSSGSPDGENGTSLLRQSLETGQHPAPENDHRPSILHPRVYSLIRPRHNLPLSLTNFIGREGQIAEVQRLLRGGGQGRLLTLIGPGGCGKTRLAIEAAHGLVKEFADGVGWIELAALSDPAFVPQIVASTLGVREQPDSSLVETLSDAFQPRQMLLLLDNCEHLLGACAQLVESLLHVCPHVQILTTSRERLNISGEIVWLVPSLSLPGTQDLEQFEGLKQSEAVRLFVERAALVLPTFKLNRQNAAGVVEICQRLDGIPLAIELAAARVNVLTVEQIAGRLHNRFGLLVSGSRTALPRHRTLRATMDWSHDLLSESEQVLFRRLSVFAGGWTIEAAEEVCTGEGVEAYQILDLLAHLVDRSLVIVEERAGAARYRMLETIRQYAQEKLHESGEKEHLRHRHLAYFLRIAEEAEPKLISMEWGVWQQRLAADYDNLRAARDWSQLANDPETELRLAGALIWYWLSGNYNSEGRQWLEAALARAEELMLKNAARAKALFGAGMFAGWQGDITAARPRYEESVSIWRSIGKDGEQGLAYALGWLADVIEKQGELEESGELLGESIGLFEEIGDQYGLAVSLSHSGMRAFQLGDKDTARSLFERSLAIRRETGDLAGSAYSLHGLGMVAASQGDWASATLFYEESLAIARQLGNTTEASFVINWLAWSVYQQGDYPKARQLYKESLALSRDVNHQERIAWTLNHLGDVARCEGNDDTAADLYREALEKFRALGHKQGIAAVLHNLGYVAQHQRDYRRAVTLFKESLIQFRELDYRWSIADALAGLAGVAGAQGMPQRAARLFGAAEGLHKSIVISNSGSSFDRVNMLEWERNVANVRAQLGERTLVTLWEEGQAMTLEQAIHLAESLPVHARPAPRPEPETGPPRLPSRHEAAKQKYGGLTAKEREVAALVTQGKSNREIADELFVGLKTVEAHLTRILSKLGFSSRAQIAAWAVTKGLAEAPSDLDTLSKEG